MTRPLYDMFNSVPHHYDLLNRIITWGLDKRWRMKAAEECLKSRPERILDLCCGTGDLALNIALLSRNKEEITGLDYSRLMLDIAESKVELLDNKPRFVTGDASELPFKDVNFDCVGISFAFRNLTYRNSKIQFHLAEVLRVIKPGGRFIIVESSQPESMFVRKLFHLYLRLYVSKIGTMISGNRGAYRYLAESASKYYTPVELKELLVTAGFKKVEYRPFLFGMVGIHVATRREPCAASG